LESARGRCMAEAPSIGVSVVLAEASVQRVVSLAVAAGTTAWQAVLLAGVLEGREDLESSGLAPAVYGKQVDRDRVLEDGDRVEILRPLPQDPKLRRRRRAREGGTMGHAGRARSTFR
jgi:putative ubiquitin-RnfH superfamily antitoxin RatB of RatAB toxin-antitoxin module